MLRVWGIVAEDLERATSSLLFQVSTLLHYGNLHRNAALVGALSRASGRSGYRFLRRTRKRHGRRHDAFQISSQDASQAHPARHNRCATPRPFGPENPDNATVLANLGLLADLAGTWKGTGFNLVARPDKEGNANLYLELNQTQETLEFTPIASAIPNRGFGMDDIELFGLTYLQQISDSVTGGARHRTGDLGAPASHNRAAGAAAVRRRHRFSDGLHSARQRHTGEGDRPEVHRPADVADIQRGLQRLDLSVLQQHAVSRWRPDLRARDRRIQSAARRRLRRRMASPSTQSPTLLRLPIRVRRSATFPRCRCRPKSTGC